MQLSIGSTRIAFGRSASTAAKSLTIQESWSFAVAICRSIIGTQGLKRRRESVCASASLTKRLVSSKISRWAAARELGGRNCQRAVFAWMAFCPFRRMAWTFSISAFTLFWMRIPATAWKAPKERTPEKRLQPSPQSPTK